MECIGVQRVRRTNFRKSLVVVPNLANIPAHQHHIRDLFGIPIPLQLLRT